MSRIRPDSPFLRDFVDFHLIDISDRFQPDFRLPIGDDVVTLLLTRDGLPAGALIGRRQRRRHSTIDLDYVLGPYRDSRLGRWLYGSGAVFRALGSTELQRRRTTDTHVKYLERVGFRPSTTDPDSTTLPL